MYRAIAWTIVLLLLATSAWAEGPVNSTKALWIAPTTNTDGSALTDLAGYFMYIASGPVGSTAPPFPDPKWVRQPMTPAASPTPPANFQVTTMLPAGLGFGQRWLLVSAVNLGGIEGAVQATPRPFLMQNLVPPSVPANLLVQ